MNSPSYKFIGNLLILGVVLVLLPYTLLVIQFDYPQILRQPPGIVLTKFHEGGGPLLATWWLFALGGMPLLWAYVLLGQRLDGQVSFMRWATTLGIVSAWVQIVGLLRWPFVVAYLANQYVATTDPATQTTLTTAFGILNQFGGVMLGEHLGQLLTIAYTVLLSLALVRLGYAPVWLGGLGHVASGIYLLAQGELVATVIPTFPKWEAAGLVGSTLWLVWLLLVGVRFRQLSNPLAVRPNFTKS